MKLAGIIIFCVLAAFILFYFLFKNIARGIFKTITRRFSTEGAFAGAPEGDPWNEYLVVLRDNVTWLDSQNVSEIDINANDGINLHGYLVDAKSQDVVIYFHGYRSNGYKEGASIAKMYYDMGYSTIIIEQRCHDNSGGEYISLDAYESLDVISWVKYAKDNFSGKVFVHGGGMGASAIIKASSHDLEVDGLICDSTIARPFELMMSHYKGTPVLGKVIVNNIYRDYKKFLHVDMRVNEPIKAIEKNRLPILFIVGTKDYNLDDSKSLFDKCHSEKKLVIIEGGMHCSNIFTNYDLYKEEIKSFLNK